MTHDSARALEWQEDAALYYKNAQGARDAGMFDLARAYQISGAVTSGIARGFMGIEPHQIPDQWRVQHDA